MVRLVALYHDHNRSELDRLGIQHQVSLDKHQRMIRAALEWQRLSRLMGEEEPKPVVIRPLQLFCATLLALLLRR